ncbi:MAG TPA: CRISPR-associated endoribonuclease Cas6 [Ruminiclostridium sp.]|nr:CRISPR-associated endoribonuclease Cas6 [Ruminiclostridium sp.]
MRFHFTCELENNFLPVDYRRKIVSFLKYSIEKSSSDFYEELYGKGNNTNKDFAMSVYFVPETRIGRDNISVNSRKMIINLSTPDAYTGIQIYNAVSSQKFTWHKLSGENAIRVIKISNEKEKIITQGKAVFNTLSPIVIRDHNQETGKDWFYTFEDAAAQEILKRNLQRELKGKFSRDISHDIDKLNIDFGRMKKLIVQCYELKIPASLGVLSLEGEQYLLQYLYQRGLGSKRSLGFGMLELI